MGYDCWSSLRIFYPVSNGRSSDVCLFVERDSEGDFKRISNSNESPKLFLALLLLLLIFKVSIILKLQPRGCGILEFGSEADAKNAVEKMHRYDYKGRNLVVKEDFDAERDKFGRIVGKSGGKY